MKLQQISIFLDNSPGRLYEATHALGKAGMHVAALSLVDNGNSGVLRLVAADVTKARQIMMEKQFPGRVDEVVAAEIGEDPDGLARVLQPVLAEGVSVDYMYSLSEPSLPKHVMIFHFSDNDRAIEILERSRVGTLDRSAFGASLETH
jgi:hypothetical protein